MAERMRLQGVENLWLDATGLESFDARFPTIAASLAAIGLDPARDWLPIAPAAHYLSGGVITDLSGATALPGLWAAGEVACTGVHGANRLASNSLLEGMVFGARLAESILDGGDGPTPTGVMGAVLAGRRRTGRRPPVGAVGGAVAVRRHGGRGHLARRGQDPRPAAAADDRGRRRGPECGVAGPGRSRPSMPSAPPPGTAPPVDRAHGELVNLVTVAQGVLRSADRPVRDPGGPCPQRLPGALGRAGAGASCTPEPGCPCSTGRRPPRRCRVRRRRRWSRRPGASEAGR